MINYGSHLLCLLLPSLLFDLLGLGCLRLLSLDSLSFGLLPLLFGLGKIAIESDLFLEVNSLNQCKSTIRVVLPSGPSQSFLSI